MQKRTTIDNSSQEFQKRILQALGEMILLSKWKKELINIVNKHIENSYHDKISRVNYKVSNIALADIINLFISLNNKSFNRDLSRIISRYKGVNQSSADGITAGKIPDVEQEINTISEESEESIEQEKINDDEIKLALINKGIKKKNPIGKWVLFLIFMIIIATVLIFVLVKMNKGKTSEGAIGAPALVE